jgi:flagellar hook-associated protein 1 FlgK
MSSSILNVGQSALQAAQIGLTTTGHNIANANTPGYTRQVVIQSAAGAQDFGFGFVGSGTQVATIQRVYDQYLNNQVLSGQTSKSALDSYYSQIQQIDNMLGDATTGVSSTLQDFFSGVQGLASTPNSAAARQAVLSDAQTLAGRFQAMGSQLNEMQQGVNSQISTSIDNINSYAQQIATLNDAIEKAEGTSGDAQPANDLLDQRDQVLSDLSKEIKVSVVKQGNSYNVFIGNGQPLVVGTQKFNLVATTSPTDLSRTEIGYSANGTVNLLPESSLAGGSLGGLLDFRANTLDAAQNSLGRVATGLAMTFNAQHELGMDQNGNLGGAFFKAASPVVNSNTKNVSNAVVTASISDANALTTSDYLLQTVTAAVPPVPGPAAPGSYKLTRLSDGAVTNFTTFPQTVDGVDIDLGSGNPAAGDSFLIRPTANGASEFGVAITDTAKIAAAAPIVTNFTKGPAVLTGFTPATPPSTSTISAATLGTDFTSATLTPAVTLTYDDTTNTLSGFPAGVAVTVDGAAPPAPYVAGDPVPYSDGSTISFGGVSFTISGTLAAGDQFTLDNNTVSTAKISAGTVDANFATSTLTPAVTLTYDATTNTLSGFPAGVPVTVNGSAPPAPYTAGDPVPYTDGATISFGGASFVISGAPATGDQFALGLNTNGKGDTRNALQLAALQTSNTLANGTTSYQGAYGQLVSAIGNKTHELDVTSAAAGKLLDSTVAAQQSISGVNLDEEATNLLRYQQAYQAAGKVMQTASQLFDLLLTLGQ